MAKQQKVAITIPKRFGPTERQAIAQDVIEFIINRTRDDHKDKNNNPFPGSYSKSYRNSLDYKIAGKPKSGKPVDLTLTGDMLDSLGLLTESNGEIVIGYPKGDEINGKVEGNRLGTYGTKTAKRSRARDFLGIHKDDLRKILERYPPEESKEIATKNLESAKKAKKLVEGVVFEEEED